MQTTSDYLARRTISGGRAQLSKKMAIDRQLIEDLDDESGMFLPLNRFRSDVDHGCNQRVYHMSRFSTFPLHWLLRSNQPPTWLISIGHAIDYSKMEGGALGLTTGPSAAQLWMKDPHPQLLEFLQKQAAQVN
jgi:hypothetical protein